jgi:hypothetical protein
MRNLTNVKQNIIIAMKICGIRAMSEGAMYGALFKYGLDCDQATQTVSEMLKEGLMVRSGCAFTLPRYVGAHGEKGTFGERSVCNS